MEQELVDDELLEQAAALEEAALRQRRARPVTHADTAPVKTPYLHEPGGWGLLRPCVALALCLSEEASRA